MLKRDRVTLTHVESLNLRQKLRCQRDLLKLGKLSASVESRFDLSQLLIQAIFELLR